MGKLFNAMVLSAMVQLSLFIFDKAGTVFSPLLNLLINPTTFGLFGVAGKTGMDGFFSFFSTGLGIAGLGALLIGTVLIRQDWLVRAGLFASLFSWVVFPFVDLWRSIATKLSAIDGGTCVGVSCSNLTSISNFGAVVAAIVVGPIILYAVWASIEYVWGGDR